MFVAGADHGVKWDPTSDPFLFIRYPRGMLEAYPEAARNVELWGNQIMDWADVQETAVDLALSCSYQIEDVGLRHSTVAKDSGSVRQDSMQNGSGCVPLPTIRDT